MRGREGITEALRARFFAEDWARALWEAGSAGHDRIDERSDIDLVLNVRGATKDRAIAAAADCLASMAPIADRWRVPEPSWHGHSQVFFRLADCPPTLLIDLVVMGDDAADRFLEPERHGCPRLLFDKDGLLRPPPFDAAAHADRARRELESARARCRLFACFVEKSLARGHSIEALHWYRSFLIRPLVLALGLKYRPFRFDFGERYLRQDLPDAVFSRLEALVYVEGGDALLDKSSRARSWLLELVEDLDFSAESLAEKSAHLRDKLGLSRGDQEPG